MANEFKIKKGLIVTGADGGTVVDVQGSQGQLFSVTDDLSGSIFAVSDISGVPILDVNSSGLSTFDGDVNLPDNKKILLGTGNDIELYHDGTHSHIINNTGDLTIDSQGDDLLLKAADDFNVFVQGSDIAIQAIGDGKVGLRYNNVEKFATTSAGVKVTGEGIFTGDVGIRTTSIQANTSLDVRGNGTASDAAIKAFAYGESGTSILGNGYATSGSGINYGVKGLSTGPRSTVAGSVNVGGYFSASNAETNYALITGTGNVGIGTTSPAAGLQVALGGTTIPAAGASTASAVFGNSTSDDNYGVAIGANSSGVGYISSQRTDGTATTYNLAIQPNGGNVGIGTDSPFDSKLQVDGRIRAAGGTSGGYFFGSEEFDGGFYAPSDGNLAFSTNNTERIRIDGNGNVGIGTTSPGTINGVAFSSVGLHTKFGTLGRTITEGSQWGEYIMNHSGETANRRAKFIQSKAGDINIGSYDDNGTQRLHARLDNNGTFFLGNTSTAYQTVFFDSTPGTVYGNGTLQISPLTSPGSGIAQFTTNFADRVGGGTTKHNVRVGGTVTATDFIGGSGAYLPLAGGTMTGDIDFVNNKDISMTDNAGAVTRVMVLNTSNTMYIGPVDTYAGGSILYGVAAGVSFQRFFTGASERLRIGSNGNVAIGTTATSYRLQVEQNNNGNLLSRFHNTAANGQGLLIRAGGVSSANRILQLASENDTKVMTVNSNGRVGIGIANPTEKLEVVGNVLITAALLSNQENTDIDTGAEVVAQVSHATYTAAFFDFVVKKGTNVRSGTVYACHNGDTTPLVEFTETSTNDLGDTSDVTLSVDISGTNMRLLATVTSDDWSVKSLIRAI
jgi:hypothetical protein